MKTVACLLALASLCLAQSIDDPYQQHTYNVFSDDQTLCATYRLAAQFQVPYFTGDPANGTITVPINLPPANGSSVNTDASQCPGNATGESTSILVVTFSENQVFTLTVGEPNVSTSVEPDVWHVSAISFTYNLGDTTYFPGSNSTSSFTARITDPTKINIQASNGQLFQCNAETTDELPGVDSPPIFFKYKDVVLNPFNTTSTDANTCSADSSGSTDRTVPIAVGVSLAALLVIVFVAYLIGRKMRRSGGYQKV